MRSDVRRIWRYSLEVGADPAIVIAGGGNSSVKTRADLWVKASGYAMGAMPPEAMLRLDLAKVRELLSAPIPGATREAADAYVARKLLEARIDPPRPDIRPSVEAVMHAAIPYKFVMHTHPELAAALTSAAGGRAAAERLGLPPFLWIEYRDPGLPLARRVAREIAACRGGAPKLIFLAKHGLIAAADSIAEIKGLTRRVFDAVRRELARPARRRSMAAAFGRPIARPRPPGNWETWESLIVPTVRGALADRRQVIFACRNKLLDRALAGEAARSALAIGPLYPDLVVYCGARPLVAELPWTRGAAGVHAALRERIARFRAARGADPQVVLIPGFGLICVGRTAEYAETVRELFLQALRVVEYAAAFGGARVMTKREYGYIARWSMEAYRRKLMERERGRKRAEGVAAMVTGGAQGVGREIAEGLLAEGACVAICDANAVGARTAAEELRGRFGARRVIDTPADVTDEDSMRAAVRAAVRAFGGLDLMIANAGILRAFKITEFPAEAWRRIIDVNLVGVFVSAKAAAEVMRWNRAGDIIQINSKSGKKGSKYNSAYAAAKFGGVGLVASIALDLIEDGIKVNAVCPGNFFDLPLWSAPGGLFDQYRAKHGNAPREEVRRIYEGQIPMGRGCTVPDVLRTIFYIMEQDYETGQAYNVTGGQEMR
ncbi:MAG TPA: SDR family NAD(P)-dependent oxidoreductase [Planctomycetota bacterium]|jgi:NAD(P)-dependent dehydrogenase (short-subunit alcohol dehydrogenase family)/rhamnose utilization protein RhaD (predicted bifunctional aldolase and dehydrogenase)|nr:SDR family NAD(P)-dependent oxidoreductase [Planctomycetota bacterium]OQC22280.1 MAG: Sorbitol-6-phosphate 2-dehydrogenase [Planctomycetes bacterium ADurb.Bin069]HNS00163.1 SDR family NAD(P)-dependent oxidoreductase [Planctomycetota bacterium]HNU25885.1 SDR family NAD(P)-dependent oxidoreductase [Planctomycetota bacterium]HOE29269.1 SDR family NAD(P)-dependent oxidoreductase [Planctomycetota bacterium]